MEPTDTQRLARLEASIDEMRGALKEMADSIKALARQEIELRGVIADGQRTGMRIGEIESVVRDSRDQINGFKNRFIGVWSAIIVAGAVIAPLGTWGVSELMRLRDDNIRQYMRLDDMRSRIEKMESRTNVNKTSYASYPVCADDDCDPQNPQPAPMPNPKPIEAPPIITNTGA